MSGRTMSPPFQRTPEQDLLVTKRTLTGEGRYVQLDVDNRWLFSYSPSLWKASSCHTNVEMCVSRLFGIRYLFKYNCKSSNRVTIQLRNATAILVELNIFAEGRYVSASEAVWNILDFGMWIGSP